MKNVNKGYILILITISFNLILFFIKLFVGYISNSQGLIADSIHTLSDVLTSVLALIGLRLSYKKADKCHPYGHEKIESVIVKMMSTTLIIAGGFGIYKSVYNFIFNNRIIPINSALYTALLTGILKEIMFVFAIIQAKQMNSLVLKADAYHHHYDGLSSFGVSIGIIGAKMGYWYFDIIAGILVCVIIIKLGINFYIKAFKDLVDSSASVEVIEEINSLVESFPDIIVVESLKTRLFGNSIISDIKILISNDLSLKAGIDIAESLEKKVLENIINMKDCTVTIKIKNNQQAGYSL